MSIMKIVLTVALLAVFCESVHARGPLRKLLFGQQTTTTASRTTSYQPTSYQPTSQYGTVQHGTVQPSNQSSAYAQALASAQYRAAHRIHGHCYLDMGSNLMRGGHGGRSGVGWSSSDSQPTTCLGRGGSGYAVVRGADGWYATKIERW